MEEGRVTINSQSEEGEAIIDFQFPSVPIVSDIMWISRDLNVHSLLFRKRLRKNVCHSVYFGTLEVGLTGNILPI